jgi:hypothetical protein
MVVFPKALSIIQHLDVFIKSRAVSHSFCYLTQKISSTEHLYKFTNINGSAVQNSY